MEGYLLVPPERSAIIGRTGWKTRYVTFHSIQRQPTPPRPNLPRQCSASKLKNARKDLKGATAYQSSDDLSMSGAETLYLSVWKQKGDVEPISHNAVGTIRSCEIQSIQLKKSDTPVPTLILAFELDAHADKVRKRRSSRAGILQPPTSAYPNSLLFRSVTEDQFTIYDWQVTIQPRIIPRSPTSNAYFEEGGDGAAPAFTGFKNPFPQGERPVISNPMMRPQPYHRHSHTKDYGSHRPTTASMLSPSPSLRSRRSDLSSQSSFLTRPAGYSPSRPIQKDELPSPTSILCYEEQFISGWTNAQGRSPTLTTHSRAGSVSASSIIPRETILDRAFNLKAIPGSEKQALEDSNMSSIARFEALMKEHEKRKALASNLKSASRKPSDSLIEERDSETHYEEDENDSGKYVYLEQKRRPSTFFFEEKGNFEEPNELDAIPQRAQMALEYISGRATPNSMRPRSISSRYHLPPRPPIPAAPVPQIPTMQGKEAGKKDRKSRPMSFSLGRSHARNTSAVHTKDTERPLQMAHLSPDVAGGGNGHKRSGSGANRLSFSEFTRRLSSTSSLLLVQNNASGPGSGVASARNSVISGQSRVSSEASMSAFHDDEQTTPLGTTRLSGLNQNAINQRPGMGPRRSTVATGGENLRYGGYIEVVNETEKRIPLVRGYTEYPMGEMSGRCGQQWRGSGLIEGGFL